MPRYIVKPDQAKDEYVLWSTIVDSPVSPVLNRKTMEVFLCQDYWDQYTEQQARESLDRADRWGISARWFTGDEQTVRIEAEDWIEDLHGHVKNADLAKLTNAIDNQDEQAVRALTYGLLEGDQA